VPSQDIVLGLYYLTLARDSEPGEGKIFGDMADIEHALAEKAITLHSKIKYRWHAVDEEGNTYQKWYDTTPGRVILGQVLPHTHKVTFDAVNKLMTKREISNMIDTVYRHCGQKDTVIFCDGSCRFGFHHAFKAGISFARTTQVPSTKRKIVDATHLRREPGSSSTKA
jgi:DNA-directed RNA polymerase subunit beta'